jgi:thiol-disulfide isomerase/thioredoxin
MIDGRQQRADEKYAFAADAFKKAIKISGGQCRRCLNDLYAVELEGHNYKGAAQAAQQLAAIAETPKQKSLAEADLGQALFKGGGDKPKPQLLEAAHAAYASAIADAPKNVNARYNDACVLAHLGRTDEAGKEFATCVDDPNLKAVLRTRAQHFAENPALAANKMAPPFQVVTLTGEHFNLDDLAGKVVLLDFWATWCGPCNEALPELKHIAKKCAEEPLVSLSIRSDEDEATWRAFVSKNGMTWPQYRDKNGRLSHLFEIEGIPHYFTIDTDGVLTAELMGSDSDVEGKIIKLLKKAHASKPAATNSTR